MNGAEPLRPWKPPLGVRLRRCAIVGVMLLLPIIALGVFVLSTQLSTAPGLCVPPGYHNVRRLEEDLKLFDERLIAAFPLGTPVETLRRKLRGQQFRLDSDTRAIWEGDIRPRQDVACVVTCIAEWRYDSTTGAITALEGGHMYVCA